MYSRIDRYLNYCICIVFQYLWVTPAYLGVGPQLLFRKGIAPFCAPSYTNFMILFAPQNTVALLHNHDFSAFVTAS